MDAPTAVLLGGLLGSSGTLLTAWLNPFSSARHAREARQVELRLEAYADGLKAVDGLLRMTDPGSVQEVINDMGGAAMRMTLLASPDVSAIYADLRETVRRIYHHTLADSLPGEPLMDAFEDQLRLFVNAARADIGADTQYFDG